MEENEVDELLSDYGDAEHYDDDDPTVFRIREPLDPAQAKLLTTNELHAMIHDGRIDLNPPYQRDPVWPEAKQIALIDSIFRNYYVPPVLFVVTDDDDGEEVRVCMDGKQRLTSIQKFMDGQIPHRDPVTKNKFWYTVSETQSKSRLSIPEQYKRIFSSKTITCVEYNSIDPTVERDMFQRVQLGVALSAAEKLRAIESSWTNWINELEQKHIRREDDGLATLIKWDIQRGRDFQCIAQVIYCCEGFEEGFPTRREPTMQKLDPWLRRLDPPSQSMVENIEIVLGTFWAIAQDQKLNAIAFGTVKQRIAPVEFVFIGVLIGVLHGCTDGQTAKEIKNLRTFIRDKHKDVRANHRVMSTMWDFIEDAVGRAATSIRWLWSEDPPQVVRQSNGKKRKRGEDMYRGSPIMESGPSAVTTRTPKR